MDEVEDNEPLVFIDDADAEAPRRRLPALWGVLAGAVLLAALGAVTLVHGRRPANPAPPPPPRATEDIAYVDEDPVSPEEPAGPGEPAREASPIAVPRVPAPTASKEEPPKGKPPAIAVAPVPALLEAPVGPPPPAPVERPNGPPPSEGPPPVEKELASAASAIADAKTLLFEVVDRFDPPTFGKGDVLDLAAKMDRLEERLKLAQGIYARLQEQATDPGILDRRRQAIRDLLEALTEGRARIRVPLALRRAAVLREEADPLAKEALDGFQPFSREAQALDVRAEAAAGKLREARRLYESVRREAPDPESVDRRLRAIDSLLADLEARFPQMSAR